MSSSFPAASSPRSQSLAQTLGGAETAVTRTRRDRRGRGMRGPMFPPFHPAFRTRREQFDEVLVRYVTRLELTWGQQLKGTEFAVEEVPPSDPSPWETGGVALGRYFPAVAGQPSRIVVYRRPIESRAEGREDLAAIIRDVIIEHVAFMLSKSPFEIDQDFES